MTTQILLPDDRITTAILRFREGSCLRGCTVVGFDAGRYVVRMDLPFVNLSQGEMRAWKIMESLAGGELREFVNWTDSEGLAALCNALTLIMVGAAA